VVRPSGLFLQSIHAIRFHWRSSIDTRWGYVHIDTSAGEACTSDRQPVNGNSDSYSHSCLCERSLTGVPILSSKSQGSKSPDVNKLNKMTRISRKYCLRHRLFWTLGVVLSNIDKDFQLGFKTKQVSVRRTAACHVGSGPTYFLVVRISSLASWQTRSCLSAASIWTSVSK